MAKFSLNNYSANRWLATDEDDGLLIRELFVAKSGTHHDQQHQDLLKSLFWNIIDFEYFCTSNNLQQPHTK
jgi:hypothetical protein